MGKRIIIPFSGKEGDIYELNVDLDRLLKDETLSAINPNYGLKITEKVKKIG